MESFLLFAKVVRAFVVPSRLSFRSNDSHHLLAAYPGPHRVLRALCGPSHLMCATGLHREHCSYVCYCCPHLAVEVVPGQAPELMKCMSGDSLPALTP